MQATTPEQIVQALHNTPQMMVLEFAGAGAQALAWLHGVGGSSRTVLEATDHYAAGSLTQAVGFEPEQFTALRVARALATNAHSRACQLADSSVPVVGVGCTATIATDRLKRGEHRCCVAVSDAQGVTTYSLTLTKGRRSRQEEEQLVSLLILKALASACGLHRFPRLPLLEQEHVAKETEQIDLVDRLRAQEIPLVTVWPDGRMSPAKKLPNVALLSGSFNPLHSGHQQLAQAAAGMLGQDVFFELPLINADKAAIGSEEAHRRVAQFANLSPVLLTAAPLFSQKAQLFPHSFFILGADTADRLLQPRFYNNSPAQMIDSFEQVRRAGCRFLVAGRLDDDHFLTLKELSLPDGYRELFQEIPESKFRVDVSSTALRRRNVG